MKFVHLSILALAFSLRAGASSAAAIPTVARIVHPSAERISDTRRRAPPPKLATARSTQAATAQVPLDRPLPNPVAQEKLAAVQTVVRAQVAQEKHPVVVFDIDDTLVRTPDKWHPESAPVPGAVPYVKSLIRAGATVVYLTGRKESERGKTQDMLEHFGLPVGAKEKLILNDSKRPTVEFKADALHAIRKLGSPVALFDNEMENARMFRQEIPQPKVAVFRLDTRSHAGDPGGKGPIYVIKNFAPGAEAAQR